MGIRRRQMQMIDPSPGELIEAGDILIISVCRKALENLMDMPAEE